MSQRYYPPDQLAALRRFAIAVTVLTVLGHTILGFEQSYAQTLVAIFTAYVLQLLLETLDAWCQHRRPRFIGGVVPFIDFLLPAHITGAVTAMLLYFNDQLWIVAFAAAVGIGSKTVFRVPVGQGRRHIFNPSNFGITVTLFAFPGSVGLVPPWQFTAGLPGILGWGLVGLICVLGTYINGTFTKRLPLIAAWVVGFILQAIVRNLIFETSFLGSLAPMSGLAFVLFTFYMISDPATTPARLWRQVAFGGSVAAFYGVFMALHVAMQLFIALSAVCAVRGIGLCVLALRERHNSRQEITAPLAAVS